MNRFLKSPWSAHGERVVDGVGAICAVDPATGTPIERAQIARAIAAVPILLQAIGEAVAVLSEVAALTAPAADTRRRLARLQAQLRLAAAAADGY